MSKNQDLSIEEVFALPEYQGLTRTQKMSKFIQDEIIDVCTLQMEAIKRVNKEYEVKLCNI